MTVAALAEAVRSRDLATAAQLLAARPALVRFDMSEQDEHSVLHYAVLNRDAPMVRLLLEHGADPFKGIWPHRDATAPLTLASDRGYDDIVAIIRAALAARRESNPATITASSSQCGELTRAVIGNRPDVVSRLLDLGLDPNERHRLESLEEDVFSWGEPLREAVLARNTNIVELLLRRGADPNPRIHASSSPLFEAYQRRDGGMIALLERHGAVADALVAGYFGLVDRARDLLAADAGVAPELLDTGADGGQVAAVRLALEHLDWASGDRRWHWHLMRPLGAHAPADRERYFECFRLIVRRAGPDARGPWGRTILHDVCGAWPHDTSTADERIVLATILLDAGARLDVRDEVLGSTPLGWACRWGRIELVRLFLDRGADAREADAEAWATPRAWAARMNRAEMAALVS